MDPQYAELILIINGVCEIDAYDILADNGHDPMDS